MTVSQFKSNPNTIRPISAEPAPRRQSVWRPQPIGLSREELRKIVIDAIG